MLTTRRSFLGSALSIAAMSPLSSRSLAAPPIIQRELTPQQFSARGGDPLLDTLGWNRAVAEAARTRRPVMARGTYAVRVPTHSHWYWGVRPTAKVHVAVRLESGVHIYSKGSEILVGRPESPASSKDERHILFGSGKNVVPGAIKDIVFDGLTFDFRDELAPLHPFTYAIGLTGVDDFHEETRQVWAWGDIAHWQLPRPALVEKYRRWRKPEKHISGELELRKLLTPDDQ